MKNEYCIFSLLCKSPQVIQTLLPKGEISFPGKAIEKKDNFEGMNKEKKNPQNNQTQNQHLKAQDAKI